MSNVIDILKELDWATILTSVLAIAAAIAAVTPTEKDDSVVARIKNLVSKFSK